MEREKFRINSKDRRKEASEKQCYMKELSPTILVITINKINKYKQYLYNNKQ